MPHTKTTDKVKKRSHQLCIHSDRQPFAKTRFSRSLCQYWYWRCKTMRISMSCGPLCTKYRVGNEAVSNHTRWPAWATATLTLMNVRHHIYLVGRLPIPHIKTTDKVKKRSPPLRIHSYGRPFTKMKFSRSLRQYWYFHCKTMRRLVRCSPFFPKDRFRNLVVGSRTRGGYWAAAMVPTISVRGFEVTGL